MHQSSILVAWINDGKPSFLLWLRLRRLVVFGEGIWRCSRCNSAMDFFWVVKLPGLHDGQLWWVFSFKIIPFNGTQYEFKGFQPISQVFAAPFVSRYIFQDGGIGTSTSFGKHSTNRSFTVLLSGSKDYICLFTATELRSCIASSETTGNLETCTAFSSWDDYKFVVVFRLFMLCWTRYHTDLEQMLKKKRQNIRQNGHWMLETSCKVGLQP